jgi:hypothetical protein
MADMSDETKAILERLKAEGDLVRNTGKNSIREVSIKLDKFMPVFQNIRNEMMFQTDILREQAGIAKEVAEARRREADLAELARDTEKDKPDYTKAPTAAQTQATDKGKKESVLGALMEGGIMRNLKDLFIIGAGGFALYNLAKGFIDKKYDGAFTKMETSIGDTATKLYNVSQIKFDETMIELNNQLKGLKDDIAAAREDWADFRESISTWGGIAELIWNNLTAFNLSLIAGTYAFKRFLDKRRVAKLNADIEKAVQDAVKRTNSISPEGGDGPKPTSTQTTPTKTPKTTTSGDAGLPPQATPDLSKSSTSGMTPGQKEQLKQDAGKLKKFTLTTNKNGATVLRNAEGGTFASLEDAANELSKTLDPKYSKFFKYAVRAFVVAGVAFTIVDVYRLYVIFGDVDKDRTHQEKIKEAGPIVGTLIVSSGAGTIGAIAGFAVGGPWGSLLGGAAAAIAAGMLTPDEFGIWVLSMLLGDDTSVAKRGDFERVTSQALSITDRSGNTTEYGNLQSFFESGGQLTKGQQRKLAKNRDITIGGQTFASRQVRMARKLAEGSSLEDLGIPEYNKGTNGFKDFGDGRLVMLHGKEAVVPRNSAAGDLLAQVYSLQKNMEPRVSGMEGVLARVEGASGGGNPIVIHNAPTVAPNVNNVIQGGSVMQTTTLFNNGGSGGGGPFRILPQGVN